MADDRTIREVLLPDELESLGRVYAEAHLLKRSEAIRLLVEASLAAVEKDDD